MNGEAIISVSAAVTALTQVLKWMGIPDKWGPVAVLVLAAIGAAMWAISQPELPNRQLAFDYFAGWIAVATSAAGIFGFTRAASSAVTAATAPPGGGAGSSRTDDPPQAPRRPPTAAEQILDAPDPPAFLPEDKYPGRHDEGRG